MPLPLGGNKTEVAFHTPPDAAGFLFGPRTGVSEHRFSAGTKKGESRVTLALAILWEVEQIGLESIENGE
jgi:hypothetical protein